MSREHQYRAYHKTLKKMQQVLAIELDPELGGVEVWGKASVDFSTGEHEAARDFWTWDEIELMGGTGLQDRNNKDIFEGDILRIPGNYVVYGTHNSAVEWSDKELGWATSSGLKMTHHADGPTELEVIGNVWENPELLEVSA